LLKHLIDLNAKAPSGMRIYEDEFYPLGGVAVEAYQLSAICLRDRFDGEPALRS
jgi:hypothetical protein